MTARSGAGRRSRGATLTGSTCTLVVVLAGAAWATVTTAAASSQTLASATLTAPAAVTATATGSATVHLAWSAASLTDGRPVQGYYVERSNTGTGATSAACGTSPTALAAVTTCDDTVIPTGTYTWAATAVVGAWTAASGASNAVALLPGSPQALVITSSPQSGGHSPNSSSHANLGPIVVGLADSSGHPATSTTSTTVTLSSSSPGGYFDATSSSTTPVTSVVIPPGATSVNVYYGDTTAGSPTVTVSATGLTSASQVQRVT